MQITFNQSNVAYINTILNKYKMFAPNSKFANNGVVRFFNKQVRGQSVTVLSLLVEDYHHTTPDFDMILDVYLNVPSEEGLDIHISYSDLLDGLTTLESLYLRQCGLDANGDHLVHIKNEYIDKQVSCKPDDAVDIVSNEADRLWSGVVRTKTFLSKLKKTSSVYSTDAFRKYLQCAYLSAEEFVVTNGHILIKQPTALGSLDMVDPSTDAIFSNPVPKSVMDVVEKMCTGVDRTIKISRYRHTIEFLSGNVLLRSTLPDEQYPNFPQIIPSSFVHEFSFSSASLKHVLDNIQKQGKPARWLFTVQGDRIEIDACNDDGVLEGIRGGSLRHNGRNVNSPLGIAFNVDYVHTVCKAGFYFNWKLSNTDPSSPTVWEDPTSKTFIVLMPMRTPYSVVKERTAEG